MGKKAVSRCVVLGIGQPARTLDEADVLKEIESVTPGYDGRLVAAAKANRRIQRQGESDLDYIDRLFPDFG